MTEIKSHATIKGPMRLSEAGPGKQLAIPTVMMEGPVGGRGSGLGESEGLLSWNGGPTRGVWCRPGLRIGNVCHDMTAI